MNQNTPNNKAITPPYQLNTIEDIKAYTIYVGARYWNHALILLAREARIKRPKVLDRLSSRSEFAIRLPDTVKYEEISVTPEEQQDGHPPFTVNAVFTRAMHRQRERYCRAIPIDVRSYNDLIGQIVTFYAAGKPNPPLSHETDEQFPPSRFLQDVTILDTIALSAIKRYVEHGDPATKDQIENITRSLCFFTQTDHRFDTTLFRIVSNPFADLTRADLGVLFRVTLYRPRTIVQRWYQHGVGDQIDRLTRRLTQLGAHPNLIRGVGDALRSISSTDWFDNRDRVKEAHSRIATTTKAFAGVMPKDTLTRVRSLAEDILKKHERFRSLFADIFDYDVILAAMGNSRNETRSAREHSHQTPLRKRIVPVWQRYTAYPTKDLHDLAKGSVSRDCTNPSGANGLAGDHLKTPEFFNIRIFDGSHWIGNIYCLAVSETMIVVDHIQFGFSKKIAAVDFVSDLRRLFIDLTGDTQPKPEVWLHYSDISNRAWLRKTVFDTTFAEYKSDLVPRENRFRSFSSYPQRRERSTFARLL